jgi:hypothetical protein
MNEMTDEVDFIKIECGAWKMSPSGKKKTSPGREKIFAKDISDKRLFQNIQRTLKTQQ